MGDDLINAGRARVGALHPKPNSDWEKRRATRTVAHHALDADDCAELLEMLGLAAAHGKLPMVSLAQSVSVPPQRKWNPHKKRWMQK